LTILIIFVSVFIFRANALLLVKILKLVSNFCCKKNTFISKLILLYMSCLHTPTTCTQFCYCDR